MAKVWRSYFELSSCKNLRSYPYLRRSQSGQNEVSPRAYRGSRHFANLVPAIAVGPHHLVIDVDRFVEGLLPLGVGCVDLFPRRQEKHPGVVPKLLTRGLDLARISKFNDMGIAQRIGNAAIAEGREL